MGEQALPRFTQSISFLFNYWLKLFFIKQLLWKLLIRRHIFMHCGSCSRARKRSGSYLLGSLLTLPSKRHLANTKSSADGERIFRRAALNDSPTRCAGIWSVRRFESSWFPQGIEAWCHATTSKKSFHKKTSNEERFATGFYWILGSFLLLETF